MQDFYVGEKLSFRDFMSWRREEVRKQKIVSDLSQLSAIQLQNNAPAYLATFAHDGNSHVVDVYGRPERWQFDLIMKAVSEYGFLRGAALDIGANVGMQSLFLSQHYDQIFAFEPHPNTFELLKYNLGQYAPGASAYNLALSNEGGSARLALGRPGNIGAFSLMNSTSEGEFFDVRTARLDQMADFDDVEIGLMKIDVEGAEHLVIDGARGIIERSKPVIIMEDWQTKNGKKGPALELLASMGYSQVLEPVFLPKRTEKQSVFGRIKNAMNIMRMGHTFALSECDFKSSRGYEILVLIHDDYLKPRPH